MQQISNQNSPEKSNQSITETNCAAGALSSLIRLQQHAPTTPGPMKMNCWIWNHKLPLKI